jgi:hypothetical protein
VALEVSGGAAVPGKHRCSSRYSGPQKKELVDLQGRKGMNQENPSQVAPPETDLQRQLRQNWVIQNKLSTAEKDNFLLKKTIQAREETIKELREDLGSLRVLEAFMRSGVIKDLGLKDDPETQALLRKFFQINLRRALQRPETLVLSDPAKEIKRSTSSTEGPENERRQRAA